MKCKFKIQTYFGACLKQTQTLIQRQAQKEALTLWISYLSQLCARMKTEKKLDKQEIRARLSQMSHSYSHSLKSTSPKPPTTVSFLHFTTFFFCI